MAEKGEKKIMRGTIGGGRNGRGVFLAEATGGATDLFPNLEKGGKKEEEEAKATNNFGFHFFRKREIYHFWW